MGERVQCLEIGERVRCLEIDEHGQDLEIGEHGQCLVIGEHGQPLHVHDDNVVLVLSVLTLTSFWREYVFAEKSNFIIRQVSILL